MSPPRRGYLNMVAHSELDQVPREKILNQQGYSSCSKENVAVNDIQEPEEKICHQVSAIAFVNSLEMVLSIQVTGWGRLAPLPAPPHDIPFNYLARAREAAKSPLARPCPAQHNGDDDQVSRSPYPKSQKPQKEKENARRGMSGGMSCHAD